MPASGAPFRSMESKTAVTVKFRNHMSVAVDLYWVDFSGQEQHWAVLAPGTALPQRTFATHAWRVREQFSQKQILDYGATNQPQQEVAAERKSLRSDQKASITFRNSTSLTVTVSWIDYQGAEKQYAVLAPGQSHTQATFVTHPWIVRDQYSNAPLDSIVADSPAASGATAPASQTLDVTGANLRSVEGGKAVVTVFKNLTPLPLELFWVNFHGEEQSFGVIQPGDSNTLSTFALCPWRLREQGAHTLIALFFSNETAQQFAEIKLSEFEGHPATTIELHNETLLAVDVFWINAAGKEIRFKGLSAKESYAQPTFATHEWRLRDRHSGLLLGLTRAAAKTTTFRISEANVKSKPGTPSVTVTFQNQTPFTLEIYWVDFTGDEALFTTVGPDGSYQQLTGVNHVWRMREQTSRIEVGFFIAGPDAQQSAAIKLCSSNSRTPAQLQFKNDSLLSIDLIWLDYGGKETPLRNLAPGGQVQFQTFLTHPWIVRDTRTKLILQLAFADTVMHAVSISATNLPAPRTDRPVRVEFLNSLPFTADLFRRDSSGREQSVATLEPGTNSFQDTLLGQPWRLRQHASQKEIALVLAGADRQQTIDIELRSIESATSTEIEFFNETPLNVQVFWVDYSGKEILFGALGPRESLMQSTYATHAWIVRDKRSAEAIAFTVGLAEPQLLRITGEQLRSLASTSSVTVAFTNGAGIPVDLQWIDFGGNTRAYGSIAPGAPLTVQTSVGSVWRMVRQGGTQVVDLFLTPKDAQQFYTIQNTLVQIGMRPSGTLYEGEVAIFASENFQGRAWVLHSDFPDFAEVAGLNHQAASIQLGPNTSATLFENANLGGSNDSFFLSLPSLKDTHVGPAAASSIQIFTTPPPAVSVLRSTATLSEDYKSDANGIIKDPSGNLKSFSTYRSIVTFPPEVKQVEVFAADETVIEVAGKQYTIDAVQAARLTPSLNNTLMIAVDATSLGTAALLLRTNTMGEHEHSFVFPDQDLNDKIVNLPPGDLAKNRDRLGIAPDTSDATCGEVQTAIQNLARAIRQVGGPASNRNRVVVADNMEFTTWSLDFSGGNAVYRPLSPAEVAQVTAGAVRAGQGLAQAFSVSDIGDFFKPIPQSGQSLTSMVVRRANDGGPAPAAGADTVVGQSKNKTIDPIATFTLESFLHPIEQGANQGLQAATDIGQKGVDVATSGVNQALTITLRYGDQALQFVADTAPKVASVIGGVIHQIGADVNDFLHHLEDLFEWGDILDTHDLFSDQFLKGFDRAADGIAALKTRLRAALNQLDRQAIQSIDQLVAQLGIAQQVNDTASSASSSNPNPLQGNDQNDWFQSKLSECIDQLAGSGLDGSQSGGIADSLDKLINVLSSSFTNDQPTVMEALSNAFTELQGAAADPASAPKLLLGAALNLIKAIAVVAIDALEAVLDVLLDTAATLITALHDFFTQKIQIPFIGDLYQTITGGRSLTLLSLACLIMAIPCTIGLKAMAGVTPRSAFANVTLDDASLTQRQRSLALAFGSLQIVQGFLSGITFLMDEYQNDQLVGKIQKVAKVGSTIMKGINWLVEVAQAAIGYFLVSPTQGFNSDDKNQWFSSPLYQSYVYWFFGWSDVIVDLAAFAVRDYIAAFKTDKITAQAKVLISGFKGLSNIVFTIIGILCVVDTRRRIDRSTDLLAVLANPPEMEAQYKIAYGQAYTADLHALTNYYKTPTDPNPQLNPMLENWKGQDGPYYQRFAASTLLYPITSTFLAAVEAMTYVRGEVATLIGGALMVLTVVMDGAILSIVTEQIDHKDFDV